MSHAPPSRNGPIPETSHAPARPLANRAARPPQLTNDDGPPSPTSSPYILAFARALSRPPFSHRVSVVIPSTQRSWIGKAHLLPPSMYAPAVLGQKPLETSEKLNEAITPCWFCPDTGEVRERAPWGHGNGQHPVRAGPGEQVDGAMQADGDARREREWWVLVPGTPAACVQLGLFHHGLLLPPGIPPIDLVLSGPNHGRNTTAAFALSSGTLGGALEASVCGVRSIALSFAFDKGFPVTAEVVDEACAHSARVVEALCRGWEVATVGNGEQGVPECFSVNVPLREGVSRRQTRWTWMLGNKWRGGSLYKRVDVDGGRRGGGGGAGAGGEENGTRGDGSDQDPRLTFKWSPTFADIWATIDSSGPDSDGLAVKDGDTSVTPLRANFESLYGKAGFVGELKL